MPWCPKCCMEYRDGFSQCADCRVELVDSRPEGADAPWRDPLKPVKEKKPLPKPRFAELGVWSGLLVSVAFMVVYRIADILLFELFFGFFGVFFLFDLPFHYFEYAYTLVFPILLNLLFFSGVFFILNRQRLFGYLTARNIAICAGMTIGGAIVSRVVGHAVGSLFIGYFGTAGLYVFLTRWLRIGIIPYIVALALIYHFTIGGLPFKKLFFAKTAAGVLVISTLIIAVQVIRRELFFTPVQADYFSVCLSFSFEPVWIPADYTEWLFRLHLLWVGIIFRQLAKRQMLDNSSELVIS